MAEVLFGQAYYLRFDPKLNEAQQPYAPLGTLFAASYLRDRGFEVALFDSMLAQSESEWADALDRHRPRYAIIYEDNFNYLSKMCLLRMREAARTMIRFARARGATVIVAGSDASDHAATYLEQGADYVLLGEGEHTLGELMEVLAGRSDTPLDRIVGLAHRAEGGAARGGGESLVRIAERRPVIKDLDALPLPAWDLIDLERYREIWQRRHGYFSVNMVTTRGCPYHCNWCAKPLWGQRYNSRSPENVVAEMKALYAQARPDHIWFMDDIMGLKPGWLDRFADLLEQEGLHIPFKCLSRADLLLRKNDAQALARAGCKIVWIGAESGSQKILDAMEKGTAVEQIYEATHLLRGLGIQVGFFIQFGYPSETREDIEMTFDMVRELVPDEIGISVSYPLPGTRFFEAVEAELGDKQNWFDSDDLDMMYKGPFATPFYRHLHRMLHKEHRAQLALRSLSRRPTLSKTQLRKAAATLYKRASLPFDRRKLERLASIPHRGVHLTQATMPLAEAAIPTPQDG